MTASGEEIASLAWSAFRAWCRDNDPAGDLSPLEQVEAYRQWCDCGEQLGRGSAVSTTKLGESPSPVTNCKRGPDNPCGTPDQYGWTCCGGN